MGWTDVFEEIAPTDYLVVECYVLCDSWGEILSGLYLHHVVAFKTEQLLDSPSSPFYTSNGFIAI